MSSPDLSGSPFETLDPRFDAKDPSRCQSSSASPRAAAGPKARPSSGRPLPGLDRHPQRPDDALGRERRPLGVPLSRRQHQRPRRRPPGPARQLRAPAAASPAPRSTARSPFADRYQGRRLNSPNDVVVRSDGSIWFTDPAYGIDHDYEGHAPEPSRRLPRLPRRPATGEVSRVADDFVRPTASPSRPTSAGSTSPTPGRPTNPTARANPRLRRRDGRTLADGGVFAVCDAGIFDGFRVDEAGRMWAAAGDGVHCLIPTAR